MKIELKRYAKKLVAPITKISMKRILRQKWRQKFILSCVKVEKVQKYLQCSLDTAQTPEDMSRALNYVTWKRNGKNLSTSRYTRHFI